MSDGIKVFIIDLVRIAVNNIDLGEFFLTAFDGIEKKGGNIYINYGTLISVAGFL